MLSYASLDLLNAEKCGIVIVDDPPKFVETKTLSMWPWHGVCVWMCVYEEVRVFVKLTKLNVTVGRLMAIFSITFISMRSTKHNPKSFFLHSNFI